VTASADLDVLVVGAGPTGLALAAQLAAHDARVRVIDRQPDRVRESRALAIQPRTLEVLSPFGVTPELIERGNSAVRLQMHAGAGRAATIPLFDVGIEDTAYPFLLFLSQAETEAVLGGHLARRGVPVDRSTTLTAFQAGDRDVACTLRGANGTVEHVRARYLAGCDGASSTVREAAGIPFVGGTYPQLFVLADLQVNGRLQPGAAHAFLGRGGVLLFFPLGRPAPWRMIAIRPDASRDEDVTLEELQAVADGFTQGTVRLRDPVWLTSFRIHHRHAVHYRAGRVFLAGDAAHVHSPAGAQGMNTGIQDAHNLGWKLALVARGLADPALLETYEAERLPVGRFVLRFTDRAARVATSANPLARFARAQVAPRLAPLALRVRPARAAAFRTLAQLDVRYRHSPACVEGPAPPRRGPRSGERLPDAPVARDGRASTLHAELAAPGYHLLLCGSADHFPQAAVTVAPRPGVLTVHRLSPDPAPGVLHDVAGQALARLGVTTSGHYLVRPDGYVGYRAGGANLAGLKRHLGQWLGQGVGGSRKDIDKA
jgi:2-polyprenyl-6-methoxyphenol hydroxylase-like FAD-dependent oxidoreductase